MSTTTVYRVETKESGLGPYSGDSSHFPRELQFGLFDHGFMKDTHPTSVMDVEYYSLIQYPTDWRHGFLLLEDLLSWFDNVKKFLGNELVVKEYTVFVLPGTMLMGTRQIVFRYDIVYKSRQMEKEELGL